MHPDGFRDLPDLARFPFTTKVDLRANYPFGMFPVPWEQGAHIHASSDTTGKPTVVGYTQADLDAWAEVMAQSIRAGGGRQRAELSGHYQIELSRAGRLDEMLVRVEARPDGFSAAGAGAALVLAVKDRVGVSARVEALPPGGVERSLGKARRVINRQREGF